MKVSYDIKQKNIVTWWNEYGEGTEDTIYEIDEGNKLIIDLPTYSRPTDLEYPLDFYYFNKDEVLQTDKDKIQKLEDKIPKIEETFRYNIIKALQEIDAVAENVRHSFFTAKPGQIITYNIKEIEARNFIKNQYPKDINDYPMLVQESKERKIDISVLADTIIEKVEFCKTVLINIEGIRLKYKDLLRSLNEKTTDADDVLVIREEAIRILQEI